MADDAPNELVTTWAILIQITLLLIILFTSYIFQKWKLHFVHETVLSVVLGLFVGLVIRLTATKSIQDLVTFDYRYFFNLLLPPIILHSGYDMKKQLFFKNIGSILVFAFAGTFMSTIMFGILVWIFKLTGIHSLPMTLLDCMVFGAILSSTDPVTVLAMFKQLQVEPRLYAIIFGESILNDSVAIVLFSTLGRFHGKSVTFGNILLGITSFMSVLFGSVVIGVVISLICAIILKRSQLYEFPALESCIILLLAYASYLLSNALKLSGIVSLLFCGITMRHYAYDNMSLKSRRTVKYMLRVLDHLSENFIFIYLGITLFTKDDESYYPGLIIFSLVLIMVVRYASVVPLANLINFTQKKLYGKPEIIPRNYQLMIWFAGLRGAISFALASDVQGPSGPAIRTTTLFVCVVSILVLGSCTPYALQKLSIRTGLRNSRVVEAGDSSSDDGGDWDDDLPGSVNRTATFVRPFGSPASDDESFTESENLIQDKRHWFIGFDERYLKPIFSRKRVLSARPLPSSSS